MAKDAETSKPKHLDPTSEYYLSSQANSGNSLTKDTLKGDNYVAWEQSAILTLKSHNKLAFIDGRITKSDPESEDFLAWDIVNSTLWASVITYYTKLLGMWDELLTLSPLESCGCPKGTEKMNWYQDLQTYQFLMGLDDKYATLRTQIINMDPFPNIDRVYAMVMQEESHRGITGSCDTTSAVGFHAQNGPPTARSSGLVSATVGDPDRTPTGRPWCTFCHRVGHTHEKCYRRLGIAPPGKGQGRGSGSPAMSQNTVGSSSGPLQASAAATQNNNPSLSQAQAAATSALPVLTPEQMQRLITFLESSPSCTYSLVGPHFEEPDWTGAAVSESESYELWHRRMGHPSSQPLIHLPTVSVVSSSLKTICDVCCRAKHSRTVFPDSTSHAMDIFGLVDCDIWGPYRPMTQFYNDHGILHQTSMVDTPKQNGRVERKHHHILEVARALRFQANLPIEFWGECVLTTAHLINCTPSTILKHKTPHELLFQKVPSFSHLLVFGCLCYAHTKFVDKFALRSRRCVFLGYPPGKKGWRVYDLETNQVFFSRDVKFEETVFPFITPLGPSPTPRDHHFLPSMGLCRTSYGIPSGDRGDTPPVTGGDPPPSPAATRSPGLSGITAGPDPEISSSASPTSSPTAPSPTLGRGKRQNKAPSVLKDYNHGLALAGDPHLSDPGPYRRLIDLFVYLTITRPDICYAVHVLSQFMQSPHSQHWDAALRVLRYLKAAPVQGLFLPADSPLQIYAFCDSDWASCPLTRCSVTEYFVSLGNSPISWRTKKQPIVSRSSAEAEYCSMAVTTYELTWLKSFILSLGVHHDRPMRLFCDNQAALHIASNPVFHERTKHIEIDCHYVREQLLAGNISTAHVRTAQQVADIFTKALGRHQFHYICGKLGIRNLLAPT
ncbi:hypothetical protein RJ639_027871 [Escallonia herrerae]|uniref:Integrase catalytic domain-containing protein n=1 Tax=Escallonia herrerae TaxID=1293975 RepID=A0AA88XJL8_9ASTE|nr:hypothetical protein RJ639_027871 [Escallonia herrerae]